MSNIARKITRLSAPFRLDAFCVLILGRRYPPHFMFRDLPISKPCIRMSCRHLGVGTEFQYIRFGHNQDKPRITWRHVFTSQATPCTLSRKKVRLIFVEIGRLGARVDPPRIRGLLSQGNPLRNASLTRTRHVRKIFISAVVSFQMYI